MKSLLYITITLAMMAYCLARPEVQRRNATDSAADGSDSRPLGGHHGNGSHSGHHGNGSHSGDHGSASFGGHHGSGHFSGHHGSGHFSGHHGSGHHGSGHFSGHHGSGHHGSGHHDSGHFSGHHGSGHHGSGTYDDYYHYPDYYYGDEMFDYAPPFVKAFIIGLLHCVHGFIVDNVPMHYIEEYFEYGYGDYDYSYHGGHHSGAGSHSGHHSGAGSHSGHHSGTGSHSGHHSGAGSHSGHHSGAGSYYDSSLGYVYSDPCTDGHCDSS